ncbi:FecR family protein [Sediminibacter sp. Hel_I_10]|uniref:FecR family protein n=1 Tax=Sediminibacter sp. Hel_I_10 TaxID=1392490 RepID=UPI00068949AF|nr:FecR family protein [Sediminibacter sp. Hel_I_10]
MTPYRDLFALAKHLARSLKKGHPPVDLNNTTLLSDAAKRHAIESLSETNQKAYAKQLEQIDTEKDWNKVLAQLQPHKTASRKPIYKLVALILILMSVGGFLVFNATNTTPLDQCVSPIAAGTDKAILSLDNGVDVALDTQQPYNNSVASSNGQRLTYTKSTTSSEVAFNYLTVPRGGQFQIELSDGTLVWLNADSKLKYPVAFKSGEPRKVELLYGEVYFEVSPSSSHNGDRFKVVSNAQEITVVGTAFNIKAYPEERYSYTTLVEGNIHLLTNGETISLKPSEQLAIELETKQVSKTTVNVDYHIAWTQGYFHFKDTPLKEIMRVLSRWYDVEIIFESPSLEQVTFSGLLNKTQAIEDILNGIQTTTFINSYEIDHKTITIQ